MGKKRFTTRERTVNVSCGDSTDNHTCNDSGELSAIVGYRKLAFILCVVICVVLFRNFVIDRVIVEGVSMQKTFNSGDVLWIQKFDSDSFERYDVVIAKVNNKKVIKRIIGLPSETIEIKDGAIYINGVLLDGVYGINAGNDKIYRLAKDEYYLLGDNREESVDSRVFGAISIQEICGKAIFRVFPFSGFGLI